MNPASIIDSKPKNKKIIFDDDGEIATESSGPIEAYNQVHDQHGNVTAASANNRKNKKGKGKRRDFSVKDIENEVFGRRKLSGDDADKRWFEVYSQYNTNSETLELKENELNDLQTLCRTSFGAELPSLNKKNPADARWLHTALHKGTSKDRANAGALLVQCNPLGNIDALDTLIGLSKMSNKASSDVVVVLADVFQEALLPSNRKLISLALRGADWKAIKKHEVLSIDEKSKIYAYWHYEAELKVHYFEFLQNLQTAIQSGQDSNKSTAIVVASRLLMYAPEKEQMLLAMLINKLGDPSNKVASKALHHVSEVVNKHPNMSGVITNETEKLLFRNNISERAQHFALCFLAQIASRADADVCTKLVNICFSFFKVLVQKGAVNNKTMQAILRCLKKAIVDAKPAAGKTEIMTKEMQDTIYRLVHLADIRIAVQTLALLLQMVVNKGENSNRFYNALYKKLLDLNLTTIGSKTASEFLHIIHRAIHIDQDITRAKAFVKRILQITLYMPSQIACGCLIILNKLLFAKKELASVENVPTGGSEPNLNADLDKFDSEGEEKYEDVADDSATNNRELKETKTSSAIGWSWQNQNQIVDTGGDSKNVKEIARSSYDPYHRAPLFAGAEYTIWSELSMLEKHFHPTLKIFAENLKNHKRFDYYGDPIRDFSLPTFLERFAFKNPKKFDDKSKSEEEPNKSSASKIHKKYTPHGSRNQPVNSLTKANCAEDELFIFKYLEKKREKQIVKKGDDEDGPLDVDDDEFEDYLDGLCKKSVAGEEDVDADFDVDFLKELSNDLQLNDDDEKKSNKKKKKDEESDEDGDDWANEENDEDENDASTDEVDGSDIEINQLEDDEGSAAESISLDEGDGGDDESMEENSSDVEDKSDLDDSEEEPQSKKPKTASGTRDFSKKLKQTGDVSSLFAAADDFAELLDEAGKIKGHGTASAVFNEDKSSEKQLKWEEKRRSNPKQYGKNMNKFNKTNMKKFKNKR